MTTLLRRRPTIKRARGLTLLEVVIASVLTLGLVTVMVKWASVVQLLANAGTSRTETSRTATLISARLGSDIDASIGCDSLRRDRSFASVGPSEVVLYTDDDGDTLADRVTWRITGTQVTRAVERGSGGCVFEPMQPPSVVTNLVRATSPAAFSVITSGAVQPLTARIDCTASAASCSFDAVRVALTMNGTESAPYSYEKSFPVDRRIYTGGVQAGALAGAGYATPGTPDAPVARLTSTGVAVSFSPPSSDGGSQITSYQITVLSGTGSAATGVTGATTRTTAASPFVFDGLTIGTSYSFTVTAVNVVGAGSASSRSNSVVFEALSGTNNPLCSTPGAPSGVTGSGSVISVSMSFTAPASDGGCPISLYEYSLDGGSWEVFPGLTSPQTILSPPAGSTVVRIRAANAAGPGPSSSPLTVVTATVPGSPGITGITGSDGALSVSFSAPVSNGGSPITSYEYSLDNGAWVAFAGTSSPQSITGLNIQTYAVRVRAVNAVGGSAPSASQSIAADGPPPAPTSPAMSALSPTSVRVTWTYASAPTDLASFRIYNSAGTLISSGIATGDRSKDVTSLVQNTSYSYYVVAVDAAGNLSSSSGTVSATTTNAAPPMGTVSWEDGGWVPITANTYTQAGSYHRLCWSADNEVYMYRVWIDSVAWEDKYRPGGGWSATECSAWGTHAVGTTHSWYVTAYDDYWAATNSNTRSVTEGTRQVDVTYLYDALYETYNYPTTKINACGLSYTVYRDPSWLKGKWASWTASIARTGSPYYDLASATRPLRRRSALNGWATWTPTGTASVTFTNTYDPPYGTTDGTFGFGSTNPSPCYWSNNESTNVSMSVKFYFAATGYYQYASQTATAYS